MKKSPHHFTKPSRAGQLPKRGRPGMTGIARLRPRSMLFTLFGDYVYPMGGEIRLQSLVSIGQTLGMSETAVRSAVARLARERWITARRHRRRSYYRLSPAGRALIKEGTQRIYHADGRTWDGTWCLLTYSIPESKRALRDRMRKQLAWLGFGQLASGTYVAPRNLSPQVRSLAERLGTGRFAKIFMARGVGSTSNEIVVRQCWDLKGIARAYTIFLRHYAPLFSSDRKRRSHGRLSDARAFIVRLALTHDYRRFPFIDPNLPRQLLPKNWAGARARTLFEAYHDLLTAGALRFFSTCAARGRASQ